MLPKYILNDVRQILMTTNKHDDFTLEHEIINPIYDMIFRYRAGEILKREGISMAEVVDVLAGKKCLAK